MKDQTVFNSLPEQALEKLEEVKQEVSTSTQKMCSAVNAYVRERPWQALGIAAAAGVLLALLLRARE